jgi:hypothetical protein
VAENNLTKSYNKYNNLNNQCDVYGESLNNLKNAGATENELIKKLKKQIANIRDILREETS